MFKKGDRVRYVGDYQSKSNATVLRDQVEGALVPISFDNGSTWSTYPSNLELIPEPVDPKNATFSIDFKMIYEDDDLELWSVTPRRTKVVYTIRKGSGGARSYRADVVIPHDTGVWAEAGVKDALHHIILGECYKKDIR